MASVRQRHTFILQSQFPASPEKLSLTPESLSMHDIYAARQDRIVIVPELAMEKELLQTVTNVRFEIVSSENYFHVPPFDRTIAWGTHIYVSPTDADDFDWNGFCTFINMAISADTPCVGRISFIDLPFGHYLYSTSTSTATLSTYLSTTNLATTADADDLVSSDYISLSFNKQSEDHRTRGKVVGEAYWQPREWTETFDAGSRDKRIEAGLLAMISDDPDGDRAFGGILAVVGEAQQFVPTLFDFEPRHRKLREPAQYASHFRLPYGLHPKHLTHITGNLTMPRTKSKVLTDDANSAVTCGLYGYYTMPSYLFVDQYQISDLTELPSISGVKRVVGIWGETDLEIPVWMVDKWGSTMLLELQPPVQQQEEDLTDVAVAEGPTVSATVGTGFDIEVPMHSRYEVPAWNTSTVAHDIPWPIFFWACNGSSESEMITGPFDSNGHGHESFFAPGTSFSYLVPDKPYSNPLDNSTSDLVTDLHIPVVPLDTYKYVQPWTVAVILLGAFWIIGKTLQGLKRDGGIRKRQGVKPDNAKLKKTASKVE
ncbi:PIG-X [Limtongia smithiae]|uniref:PIG-X n=1 Tax=Limtongia smithiae TaxID=1125753 RepID=UPI0034CD8A3D